MEIACGIDGTSGFPHVSIKEKKGGQYNGPEK
jgi:hypothetical protein